MLLSEYNAEWMALLVLCPQRLRDGLAAEYEPPKVLDEAAIATIADTLKIPAVLIRSLMSDYYDRALERLTGETLPAKHPKGYPAGE